MRRRLIDYGAPTSLGARIRLRRWNLVLAAFPDLASMDVVDLGGTPESWTSSPVMPAHVTLVNLDALDVPLGGRFSAVQGDACAPPAALMSRNFDLVFSNSVIEHVGGHARRVAMAEVVRALSDRHWVQTPYRYFPVEPHWLFPLFQSLPAAARVRIVQHWHLAGWYPCNHAQSVEWALGIELLSHTEMGHYFPGSDMLREQFAGLTKSLIALKRD